MLRLQASLQTVLHPYPSSADPDADVLPCCYAPQALYKGYRSEPSALPVSLFPVEIATDPPTTRAGPSPHGHHAADTLPTSESRISASTDLPKVDGELRTQLVAQDDVPVPSPSATAVQRALGMPELLTAIIPFQSARALRVDRAWCGIAGPILYRRIALGEAQRGWGVFRLDLPVGDGPAPDLRAKSDLLHKTILVIDHGHEDCDTAALAPGVRQMLSLRTLQVTAQRGPSGRSCASGRECVLVRCTRPDGLVLRCFTGQSLGRAFTTYATRLQAAETMTVTLVMQLETGNITENAARLIRLYVMTGQYFRLLFAADQGDRALSYADTGLPSMDAIVDLLAVASCGFGRSYSVFFLLRHPHHPASFSSLDDIAAIERRVRERFEPYQAALVPRSATTGARRHNMPILTFGTAQDYMRERSTDELDESCSVELEEAVAEWRGESGRRVRAGRIIGG